MSAVLWRREHLYGSTHTHNVRSKKFFSSSPIHAKQSNSESHRALAAQAKIDIQNPFEIIIAYFCGAFVLVPVPIFVFFLQQCVNAKLTWWSRAKIFWANTKWMKRISTLSIRLGWQRKIWTGFESAGERRNDGNTAKSCRNATGKLFYYQIPQFCFLPLLFGCFLSSFVCHIFSAQFWLNLMSSSLYWRFTLLWWQWRRQRQQQCKKWKQHTAIRHTDNSELPNSMNCTEKRNEFNICNGTEKCGHRGRPLLPSLERAWSKPFYELILFSICFSFNFNRISFLYFFVWSI